MTSTDRDVRPWGWYVILYDDENSKVKKIHVNEDSRLSLQKHNYRREVWTCIKGNLGVHLDGQEIEVKVGQSISIPTGSIHRAYSIDGEVEFIEVQTGTYFGEDDIIRLEDDYGR